MVLSDILYLEKYELYIRLHVTVYQIPYKKYDGTDKCLKAEM